MALETAGDVGSNYRMAGDRIANRRSPRLRNPDQLRRGERYRPSPSSRGSKLDADRGSNLEAD